MRREKNLLDTDELTNMIHRKHYAPYVTAEWERLAREVAPIALILCDLDCLHAYNYVCGHLEGDRCLQQVAEVIRKTAKLPGSLAVRYGGNQFAVILPNNDAIAAMAVAENICENVRAMGIPNPRSMVSSKIVTISSGVACTIPQEEMSHQELFRAADEALETSKETGRDRFTLSETLNYQLQK